MADEHVGVPDALAHGVPMLKISSKKIKQVIMRLEDGAITWAGAKSTRGKRIQSFTCWYPSQADSPPIVPISQIRELRMGQPPTETYNSTRWITIVYVRGSQMKVLHMIALTDDVFDLWVTTLRTLVSETSDRLVNEVKPADPDLLWIRQLWPAGVKAIDQPTATALLRQVGLVVPESWKAAPRSMLDMSDFRQLVNDAQSRPEIEELFSRLAPQGVLGRAQVEGFLRDVQRVEPGDLFDKYARKKEWTVDSLAEFLSSPDNSPKRQQDLTHSIVDYFISSSHNTYLVGEQWRGESTVEGYIRVLLAGCRCVESEQSSGILC
jgi:phosphatidylinositol phospholipase C delta